MITLTRPGGAKLVVNADLIETIDLGPGETGVTLTTGNVLTVVESPADIVEAVVAYRLRISGHSSR